jgi:hypothetical protein
MEDNKQSIWDFDRIASCSAIFIALLAMGAAIYEARVTREHQEISVWPSLTWYNTNLAKVGDRYNNYGTYLKNNGIGPAIIKKITLKYEDKEYANLGQILGKILPNKKDIFSTDKSVVKVILPGREIMLVTTNFTKSEQMKFDELGRNNIESEICYCSLYNTCWLLSGDEHASIKNCDQELKYL